MHSAESRHGPEVYDTRVLPFEKKRDAYEMSGRCGNCGWTGTLKIAHGEKAPAYGLGRHPVTCPRCKVNELVAVLP